MNTYKLQLVKIDEDGDEYTLDETELTADQAIDALIELHGKADEFRAAEVAEEIEEDEPEPVPEKKPKRGRPSKAKPCCGSKGPRHKKDCPEAGTPAKSTTEKYQAPGDVPWYYQDILDRLKDEESEESIYIAIIDRITEQQFREALEWAKSELI